MLLAVRAGPARQALAVMVVTDLSPAEHAIPRPLAAAVQVAVEPILAVQVARVES